MRDFSINDDTVPAAHRGTYLAFTNRRSNGIRHLRQLARSGLNTVHLLPVNDIATIEERRSAQEEPACDLAAFPPDSEEQQDCVADIAEGDGFNWGYDPLHYTTPEGSYATNPEGTARTLEFRRMVQGLNGAGLRAVIDVVYNHTPAAGQDPKSILDRVVPGYYQRLNPTTGAVETSSCCANTATEHTMMEKLMIDSVVTWAKEYKLDGFRFDLMGHQPKSAMENCDGPWTGSPSPGTVSTAGRSTCTGRAGTSVRSPTTPASCKPRSWRWRAPASAPSTTGSATQSAAAGRSTRTRESKVSLPANTPTPTVTRSTAAPPNSATRCCSTRTGSRSG